MNCNQFCNKFNQVVKNVIEIQCIVVYNYEISEVTSMFLSERKGRSELVAFLFTGSALLRCSGKTIK